MTVIIINLSLTFLTLLFLMVVTCSDPGTIKAAKSVPFMSMLERFDATQLCPECCTLRTIRSRHCNVCGQCVERFDHHCPWVNNCIGVSNHNSFLLYLLCQYALILVTLGCCINVMARPPAGVVTQLFDFGLPWQQEELYVTIALGSLIGLTGLFLVFMSLLVFV